MAQAVYVQIFRQTILPQDFLETKGKRGRHHRVTVGLAEQVVIFLQRFSRLLALPRALLFPRLQQFCHLFTDVHHPVTTGGLGRLHKDGFAAQLHHIALDVD